MDVRRAKVDEAATIAGVHEAGRAAYYGASYEPYGPGIVDWWRRQITEPDVEAWVAEIDGSIQGVSSFGWTEVDGTREFELFTLHVDPATWGRGVGSSLHDRYAAALQRSAAETGLLEVWDGNDRAVSFYRARGWYPDGTSRPADDTSSYLRLRLAGRPG